MNPETVVVVVVVPIVALLLWIVLTYNRFVSQRAGIDTAWAGVDVQLQRRHDLVPNLVETVKGYAAHEREVLEQVTSARAAAVRADEAADMGPSAQAVAEGRLESRVHQLFAVAEGYPDLTAAPLFRELQGQLTETEDRIAAARRIYNLNVRDHNERVLQVPSMIIANWFGFGLREYFDAAPGADKLPALEV